MSSFRDLMPTISPSWLATGNGEKYLYSTSVKLDELGETCKDAVKCDMPQYCDSSALPYIGIDRGIDRGPTESDDAYGLRLKQWRDTWRLAGSAIAMLKNLQAYFYPLTPVCNTIANAFGLSPTTWYTIDANGVVTWSRTAGNWNWGGTARWWEFWVVIGDGHPWSQTTYGDGHTYGDGRTWGSDATADQVADIQRIVKKWKRSGSYCGNIIVSFVPGAWDPNGSGAGYPDGTWNVETNRPSTAAFWPGEAT